VRSVKLSARLKRSPFHLGKRIAIVNDAIRRDRPQRSISSPGCDALARARARERASERANREKELFPSVHVASIIASINPSLAHAKHLICGVHAFAYLPQTSRARKGEREKARCTDNEARDCVASLFRKFEYQTHKFGINQPAVDKRRRITLDSVTFSLTRNEGARGDSSS